jgi:hypothetical protein
MPETTLHYEPHDSARPVTIERDGDVTRVIVASRGPAPGGLMYWIAAALKFAMLRRQQPPRAIFEITAERVKLTLREIDSSETRVIDWPRDAILEARSNRYGPGLWLDVAGHLKDTILEELPKGTIQRLETALRDVLGQR